MKPDDDFSCLEKNKESRICGRGKASKNLLSPDRLRFAFGLYGEAKNKRGELAWLTWNIETKLSFYYCLLCAETAYQPSSNNGTILCRKSF